MSERKRERDCRVDSKSMNSNSLVGGDRAEKQCVCAGVCVCVCVCVGVCWGGGVFIAFQYSDLV